MLATLGLQNLHTLSAGGRMLATDLASFSTLRTLPRILALQNVCLKHAPTLLISRYHSSFALFRIDQRNGCRSQVKEEARRHVVQGLLVTWSSTIGT